MRRGERIPLHDHSDGNSGGRIASKTVIAAVGGTGAIGGGASASIPDGTYVLARDGGEEVYYSLGTLGTAATVNLANGNWQYGTLGTACTFAFTAPNGAYGNSFVLELAQGTVAYAVTFPASVNGGTALAAGIGTASTTTLFVFLTRDGGANWMGYQAGSGGAAVAAINDLTDVTITSAQENDTLRYVGGIWINDDRKFRPVTHDFGSGPELVWDGDDLVMEWF